jgi:hypothetical protein
MGLDQAIGMRADADNTGVGLRETAPAPAAAAMRWATEGELCARGDTGRLALVELLRGQFPVVRKLLGEDSFAALAEQFVDVSEAVPALPRLADEFPQFLRGFRRGASVEYLADIAELEGARVTATRFLRIPALPPAKLSSALRNPIGTMRFDFHPSVSLIKSRFPIVTIWELNQADEDRLLKHWGGERALIASRFGEIAVWRLPPGGFVFLGMLLGGATWASAIAVASGSDRGFDVDVNRALLIEAGILIRLRNRSRHQECELRPT